MKPILKKVFFLLFACITSLSAAIAQTQVSPKYSPDGTVKSMVAKGDTLIVAGSFANVGIYTGGGALFTDASDKPNLSFPKIVGNIYCSTPDGNGGFYIYGEYRRESETNIISTARIEHVLSDLTFEAGFSIAVDALYKLNTILYNNGVLYIGGDNVYKINGQNAGNLSALNVSTKQLVTWIPTVNGKITGLFTFQNILYTAGNFTTIGGQNRNGLAAIEINSGIIKPWNPSLNGNCNDIKFYRNKIILGGGFSDALFNNYACALVDSVTGSSIQYIYNSSNLYQAASVSKLALKGDTLFTFTAGTGDTRITAVNLANNNAILWKKYFNQIAQAFSMEIIDNFIYVVGSNFDAIYKTNLINNDTSNIERNIKGAVKLSTISGNVSDWYPDPVGLVVRDVNTMSIANKNIFIGGTFSHVNGLERHGIFMLNTTTDEVLPFKIDLDYFSKDVNALKLIDSTLYLAGDFSTINGQPYLSSVISYNVKNGQLLPWHPVKLGSAWAIEANNRYIFLGGALNEPAGGTNRTNLFAIDRQTGALSNWSPNPDNYINPSSLHISKEGQLFVGGKFNNISGSTRNYIASYDTTNFFLTNWQANVSVVNSITSSDTTIWIGNSSSLFFGYSSKSGLITDRPTSMLPANGKVNSILVKGQYVIAGGEFIINGGACNDLLIYNILNKSLVPNGNFCQSFTHIGGINAMAFAGNDLYFGGDFVNLNGKLNAPNVERIKFPIGFFGATPDSSYTYFPKSGGNGGDVTVNFYSYQIVPGLKVKLSAPGLPDIIVPDSLITFPQPYRMQVTFDLRNKTIGNYDLIILKNLQQTIFSNGFKIDAFIKPIIAADISGGNVVRIGRPELYNITLTNMGNADARAIPVWLITSSNLKTDIQIPIVDKNGLPLDTAVYSLIDTLDNVPFSGKLRIILIPQIRAGEIYNIPIVVNSNGGTFLVRVFNGEPLMQSPPYRDAMECLAEIGKQVGNDLIDEYGSKFQQDAVGCIGGLIDGVTKMVDKSIEYTNQTNIKIAADLTWISTEWAIDCVGAAVTISPLGRFKTAFNIGKKLWKAYKVYKTGSDVFDKCSKLFDKTGNDKQKSGESVISHDPNDKIGVGIGSKNFVSANEILQYGIKFENIANATADAQIVRILDTLDKTKLNLSTFQLNSYNIGKRYFSYGPGQKFNSEFIDLRPQRNLILRTKVNLDTTIGIFSAEFTSLDPITLQLTNSLLGFLPPNVNAPEGEGGIYFTVEAKPDLPNKSVINNKALIYFDNNLPIATPVWSNTLDKVSPISKVNNLPVTTTDTTFTVNWQGTDGESGIERYNIYYAVNGSSYRPLVLKTNLTSTTFTGKVDSTYFFYSIAVDSAGNIEQKNPFDTKTTIIVSPSNEIKIYPNPNPGTFTVVPKLGTKISGIILFDLQGRKLESNYTVVNNNFRVSINNLVPFGMYILKIQTDDKVISKKIIIKR